MSRTRQHGPKVNTTARHYFELPVLHRSCSRLNFGMKKQRVKLDQSSLARYLGTQFRRVPIYFPDTCLITGPVMDEAVWDQLLQRPVCLTELVMRELAGWLMAPCRHSRLWRLVVSARLDRHGPVWIDCPERWPQDHLLGIAYYSNLLAERKRRARDLALQLEQKLSRTPTDDELNGLFQKGWARRDFHVVRSGAKELRTGGNVFTDEHLVVTACAVGLFTGNDTVVLTRDRGVFDQFAKLTSLLTMHYQGMRFAEAYAAYRSSFEITPMPIGNPDIDAFFVAENSFLVRKPVALEQFVDWLLPHESVPVGLHCILLGGEADSFSLDHCFLEAERDMDRIIRMKGRTRGWNTDRIRGRNCHATGFPRGIPNPRHFVAVVQDREIYLPDGTLAFPKLDIAHTVFHDEVLSAPVTTGTE